jgi:phage shock protein C
MTSEIKRLYRSRDERMIAGVCGGLAEYLGLDPTIVRLLFVLVFFIGGSALLVYFVMMLVVPEEPITDNLSGNVIDLESEEA